MALYGSCVPSIDEKVQAIMLERTRYPAGVPCWVDTAQRDPRAAVAFYGGLFGWEFEDTMPPDSPVRYSWPDCVVAMSPRSVRRPISARRRRSGAPTSRSRAPMKRPPG